jgi:catechol 2,3-dioxygenase-like lactoylglutathione lyase family enzyme
MTIELDHLILPVNDAGTSVAFYTDVMGFAHAGQDGPFAVLRVTERLMLLLSPFGTQGGLHLAFAMTRAEFEGAFERIKLHGVPYGDKYDNVGTNRGPGPERSARGTGTSIYLFDPDRHLLEILHYEN